MTKRWIAGALIGMAVVSVSMAPHAGTKKDTSVRVVASLAPKLSARTTPFHFGMTSKEAIQTLQDQIDGIYADKLATASVDPRKEAAVTRERDRKKKEVADRYTVFLQGKGVSGYEMVTPGEFTYGNNESVLEVPRPGIGARHLFFIGDRLYKVYDVVPLEAKDAELGETWDQATGKLTAALGTGGAPVAVKSESPSYYGTLVQVPAHLLWSDGTTQVRLVDHTHREDSPTRQVGLVYEELATVQKLPTLRVRVESKAVDAAVERAGADGSGGKARPKS